MLMLTIACRCRCYDHEQYRHHAVILSSIVDSKERKMWKRGRGGGIGHAQGGEGVEGEGVAEEVRSVKQRGEQQAERGAVRGAAQATWTVDAMTTPMACCITESGSGV